MPNYNGFNYGPSPMNPGFGPEGDFKGKWFSKKTGETVYVRDNIITESGMQVMLADGRLMDLNDFGNEYIRVSDEVYDKNGKVIDQSPVDAAENIVPPYFPHDHEDHAPMMPPPPPPHHHHHHCDCDDKPFVPPIPPAKPCPTPNPDNDPMFREGSHMYMVKSVFEKADPAVTVKPSMTVTQTNFPKNQLQMLIDIFGVHIDDIAAYMYRNYFSSAKILAVIKEWLTGTEVGLKEKVVETKPETPATPGDISKPATDGAEPNPQSGVNGGN